MSIRWDPLLVHHLARELEAELVRSRLRAVRLDGGERDLVLLFRDRSLLWRLHPNRGWLSFGRAVEPDRSDLRLSARVRSVGAPPDERVVRFELVPEKGPGHPLELLVELVGNRWNAIVTEGPERTIRHVLTRRQRPRALVVGSPYTPPRPTDRRGVDGSLGREAWLELLGDLAPEDRARTLVRSVAWTSPLNAPTLLGAAAREAEGDALAAAHGRWLSLVSARGTEPVLVEEDGAPQPYPFPLIDVHQRRVESLIAAFRACAEVASREGEAGISLELGPDLLKRLEETIRHHGRRLTRLTAELDGLEDADELRAMGDLVLARYGEIPTGASEVELTGFDGETVVVRLDPTLPPHGNAERYYDRAGRMERARARLPALIRAARADIGRFEELRARALAGEVGADGVRRALPDHVVQRGGGPTGPSLPYRTFRSSGGLEIRVGRGARHNDDLTFRHSAPGDAWLHARHTAGAHVVLRWSGDGPPPARDLQEAAVLAALHSKARTSGSVPVDWTFRKYVRKPRGSGPGKVLADRVRTLFVTPDEEVAERLAEGA